MHYTLYCKYNGKQEEKEFQLVDSSKVQGGAGGAPGGKRFVPQAKRRANAARLRQLNARRNDNQQGANVGRYGLNSQPQRTKWGRYVYIIYVFIFMYCMVGTLSKFIFPSPYFFT